MSSMGIRNTLAFEETEDGAKEMFEIEVNARKRFMDKVSRFKLMGCKCLVEEDDYFDEKK